MPLNIGDLLKPFAEATTSIGQIYLYRWNASNLRAFRNLSKEKPDVRIRTFLQHVASFNQCGLKRQPLKDDEVNLLTDADLDNLLYKYVTCNPVLALKSYQINQNSLQLTREENESAIAFLDRNLGLVIHQDNQNSLRMTAKLAKLSTEFRLESFRTYTEELEGKFQQDKESLFTKQNQLLSGLPNEEREIFESGLSDDYYTIEEVYIGQYRKSTLVSIYSFLEYAMNDLCKLCQKFYAITLNYEHLKGAGITRAKLYLEKVIKVNFETLNPEWDELQNMNKVRNRIVHADGVLDENLKNLVVRTQGLSINNYRDLLVDRTYIDFSITTVERFLEKLYSEAL